MGGGPKFVTCYLCGQQYGLASLPIHQQSCYRKQLGEWNASTGARGPPPTHPSQVPNHGIGLGQTKTKGEGGSGGSGNVVVGGLIPCTLCGRKFVRDRIEKHQEACAQSQKKRTAFNSAKQRAKDTELEDMPIPHSKDKQHGNTDEWKNRRKNFLNVIRNAKKTQDFVHEFEEVCVPTGPSVALAPMSSTQAATPSRQHTQRAKFQVEDRSYMREDRDVGRNERDAGYTNQERVERVERVERDGSSSRMSHDHYNQVREPKNSNIRPDVRGQNNPDVFPVSQRQAAGRRQEPPPFRQPQKNHVPSHREMEHYSDEEEEEEEDEDEEEDEEEPLEALDPYCAKLYAEYLATRHAHCETARDRNRRQSAWERALHREMHLRQHDPPSERTNRAPKYRTNDDYELQLERELARRRPKNERETEEYYRRQERSTNYGSSQYPPTRNADRHDWRDSERGHVERSRYTQGDRGNGPPARQYHHNGEPTRRSLSGRRAGGYSG
eukprot:NODE_428_length_1704_cov_41.156495_g312_i0.p1 GENE.NODE_428_length_1704_cov_41.156495_g312_i0~~NODE_428_length_1704_cov_41.156495_g312_i0.p1  ORF type:complete len:496 (+),score=89.87 NODE_428_length_1704_cov_41.156495_g312_i0:87-1574(+)